MRKKVIAANWKMNKDNSEAIDFVKKLKKAKLKAGREAIICAPFTALSVLNKELKASKIKLGAQNVYCEDCGAFTGEVSAKMLKALVEYVITGHSERRQLFNENDELINSKIKNALKNNLKVILCVGETLEERQNGRTKEIVEAQLRKDLQGIDPKNIILAYEPIWAISKGNPNHKSATAKEAQRMHSFVREVIAKIYSKAIAEKMIILYGGSMKPENVKELMAQEDIDGGLVGNASLELKSFIELINF